MTDIYLYIYLLISISVFYLIGHSVLFLLNIKQAANVHINLFSKLTIGLIFFIFIYSFIATKGKSIHLEFIIIGAGILYLLKKENLFRDERRDLKLFFRFDKNGLLLVFETLVIATLWFLWQEHFSRNMQYTQLSRDLAYYFRITEYMDTTGNENVFTTYNLFDPQYQGTSPYHYFELWLNAGLSWAFSLLTIIAYMKLEMPIFLTIISIGIIAIFKNFFKGNYFNLLLPLLLFTQAIYLSDFLTSIDTFTVSAVVYAKFLPIYLFITAFFVFYNINRALSLIILLIIPVATISATAGVYSSLTLFVLYNLLFKKSIINKTGSVLILVLIALLFIFCLSFYSFTGVRQSNIYSVIDVHSAVKSLKTSVNIMGATSLQIAYLYFLYALLFFAFLILLKIKFFQSQNIIALLFLICFTSLVVWAILFQMLESVQIFQNISIPFINMTIIYFSIVLLFELRNKMVPLLIFLFLMVVNTAFSIAKHYRSHPYFSSYEVYSSSYVDSIQKWIADDSMNPTGIFLLAKQDYVTVSDKVPIVNTLGDYLKLLKSNFNTISLSVFDTPLDSSTTTNYNRDLHQIKSSVFYSFVENQKQKGMFTSIPKSQIDFIKEHRMQYGIVSKNVVLSPDMNSIISQTIEDSKTGERFVIFKY